VITKDTASRSGSTREMVSSSAFATQTEPNPTATAVGPLPTGTCWVTRVTGSSRVMVPDDSFVIQSAPNP
jgi:hypothetical protein